MRIEDSGLPPAYWDSFRATLSGGLSEDDPAYGKVTDLGFPSLCQAMERAGTDVTDDDIVGRAFVMSEGRR